jgi:hypothetical protein
MTALTTRSAIAGVDGPGELTVLSELSGRVNHYRCDLCGHVWTVSTTGLGWSRP